MAEQQQPSRDREMTVSEINSAGAPNYAGRADHPQVHIDPNGLMYICGPINPFHSHTSQKSASVPVKLVALGEQGDQQYAVRAANDEDDHLALVVNSDLLRIDRRNLHSATRTPWLTVPANNLSYVKVSLIFLSEIVQNPLDY